MPTEQIIILTHEGQLAMNKMPRDSAEYMILSYIKMKGGQVSSGELQEELRGNTTRIGLKSLASRGYIDVG
jgi:hypothetical protein